MKVWCASLGWNVAKVWPHAQYVHTAVAHKRLQLNPFSHKKKKQQLQNFSSHVSDVHLRGGSREPRNPVDSTYSVFSNKTALCAQSKSRLCTREGAVSPWEILHYWFLILCKFLLKKTIFAV